MKHYRHAPSPDREAGFSLVEMLVALVVMVEVLTLVLLLFDVNNRVARVQTQLAEMQQSQRVGQHEVVRLARMAGRGGLPQNLAVRVETAGATTKIGDSTSPPVVEDTDILTVRGVYRSPIFSVDYQEPSSFVVNDAQKEATLVIRSLTNTGVSQPIDTLEDMVDGNSTRPEPLLLVSSVRDEIWAVVEVKDVDIDDLGDLDGDGNNDQEATITLSIDPNYGNNPEYLQLSCCQSGGALEFPDELDRVGFAGVLDELRLYVRDSYAIEDDETSEWTPRLSMARFYPNTDIVWDEGADGAERNLRVDFADHFIDLQVALALDRNGNGLIDREADGTPTSGDEWLFNHPDDDGSLVTWTTAELHLMQIATLARTPRADPNYAGPPIDIILDHVYNESALPASEAERLRRLHRRSRLVTTVDVRNL